MKLKDVLNSILLVFGVAAFILVVGMMDSLPAQVLWWIAVIVSPILWAVYLLLVVRDNARDRRKQQEPEFFVKTGSGNVVPLSSIPTPKTSQFYDQEEDN